MSARRNNWFTRLFGDAATSSSSERAQDFSSTPTPGNNTPPANSDADPSTAEHLEPVDNSADQEPEVEVAEVASNMKNKETLTVFDPTDLGDADFYRRMRVTLQPIDIAETSVDTNDLSPSSPVRPFSGDTLIRLTLDTPRGEIDATFPLSAETLEDRGPVEDLYRMGYRNLWQDLVDSDLKVTEISPGPKEKVWLFEGTSPYVGSAPIFLEELIEKFLPQIDMASGVLFTMPSNSQMLVRDVTAGMELFHTIGLLATATADEYFKSPDKISPRLHLWHEGQIETISDIKMPELGEEQTEIQIKPTAYLMSQMNEGPDAPEGWMKGLGGDPDDPDDPDSTPPPPVT